MLNLPADFVQKYHKLLGEERAASFLAALAQKPKKAFRINPLKAQQNVAYPLERPVPAVANAWYGHVQGQDPEWVSGTVYSQEPAAMYPAQIADVQPGERVLDLCAAPGGKSTALGERLQGEGLLVANEIVRPRARVLRENLERWGVANALITSEKPEVLARRFPRFFTKVVVDAPCSGEGMFRKNPQATDYWSQDYVLTCQRRQKEILTEAVKCLQPGGTLVYSTCTFAPEEDEQIVAWLVAEFGFKVKPVELKGIRVDHGHPEWAQGETAVAGALRFWPNAGIGEGQFVAKLVLPDSVEQALVGPRKKQRRKTPPGGLAREEAEFVNAVLGPFNLPLGLADWRKTSQVSQGHVFIPALPAGDLHLRVLNNGLELGVLKKKRFEPGHQLALVLAQVAQSRVVELGEEDYLHYLHGETVLASSTLRGFVLVSRRGLIFSFGKLTASGVLKNFYPKGLRILKKD